MGQFLGPETDIMGERYFMSRCAVQLAMEPFVIASVATATTATMDEDKRPRNVLLKTILYCKLIYLHVNLYIM